MHAVQITDPAWQTTFPHRVAPRPEEWIAGVFLCCDEANGWDRGRTLAYLFRTLHRTANLSRPALVLPPSPAFLQVLAGWLAVPESTLLATTYGAELTRLYERPDPPVGDMGAVFHFCPACLAERRLLRRTLVLPHITCCPLHQVQIADLAWLTTFPHRVMPQDNEWLAGLLLRCDEVNHWESRTTLAHLFRSSRGKPLSGTLDLVVAASWMLEVLGKRLMLPRNMLLATTYHAELARLYGPTSPHVSQLKRAFRFRLCPDCIAETRLLRRTVLLPHIMFCPLHHVAFLRTCQCGAVLEAFPRQTLPFMCSVCGLDWAHLPRVRPTPAREKLEQKLLSCYDFFFTQGTPELLRSALQLIREKLKKEKLARVELLDGKIKQIEHYELTKASLGYLVELLTSLDLPFPLLT